MGPPVFLHLGEVALEEGDPIEADALRSGRRDRLRWSPSRCAALALFLLTASTASGQRPHQTHYTPLEGLPQTQVWSIYQSRLGFLWFGTYGGLSRYDGFRFRTWTTEDGLSANFIGALGEDARGRLVVGTVGGGVCLMEEGEFDCLRIVDGLAGDTVWDVVTGSDGSVWVATDGGASRLVGDEIMSYTIAGGLSSDLCLSLLEDRSGRIWLGTANSLALFDGDHFEVVASDLPAVRSLAETPDGLLVATESGLYRRQESGGGLEPALAGFEKTFFQDIAAEENGDLWVGSRSGILRIRGESVRHLTRDQGLLSNDVRRVYIDREGNVWFGSDGGASKLVPGPFETYTEADGLPSSFVRAVIEDREGRVWLATRQGVAVIDEDRIWTLTQDEGLPCSRVYALAALAQEGMLIGTECGLVAWDGELRVLLGREDLPNPGVLSLLTEPDGSIWIGTRQGLARLDGENLSFPATELRGDLLITLRHDPEGRVWAGRASGGVAILDGDEVSYLGSEQGLSDAEIWSMDLDRQGRMWVGTNGDGAFRVAGSEIERFSTAEGLHNNFVWQVLADSSGNVWLYTNRGLDRWDGESFSHYGMADGLIHPEGSATAALEDRRGRLWFGTAFGATLFTPSEEIANPLPPGVVIEQVRSEALGLLKHGARVKYGSGAISAVYAGLSFRDELAVRFRYRLIGSGSSWSPVTADRTISYTHLAPGPYELQVMASNDTGVWSPEPASFAFVVAPAPWQTAWFRALILLAVLAAIALLIFVRTRHLETDRRRLESEVALRTAEVEEKNRSLALEVAERRETEEALQRSEQRVRQILEHTSNLFYSRDLDDRFTYLSAQVSDFFDCSLQQAMQDWKAFITDDPANAVARESTRKAIETGKRQPPYELKMRGLEGREIIVSVNEAPVVRDGRTVAIVGALTDISEAKEAEASRLALESRLIQSRKLEAVGQLAGGVAHDFNNVLTSILCSVDSLSANRSQCEEPPVELEEIRQAANRAASLTKQLLAFSRKQVIQPRVVNLNAFVQRASRILARMIGEDIDLVTELEPALDPVKVDLGQLDQVLMNLAANARDAMPTGGRLLISLSNAQLKERRLVGWDFDVTPGRYVLLRFADSGSGIPKEAQEHVFEPFFTTKEAGVGTGLGLSTVYGIVKQNKGYITLETEEGMGTVFNIYLRSCDQRDPAELDVEPAVRGTGAGTILFVEDDDAVRKTVSNVLRKQGFELLVAANAQEALELCAAKERHLDLLLTDLVMPGIDGDQLAELVVAERPATKVLLVSGHTDDAVVKRGVETGSANFLQKPFSVPTLVARINELLGVNPPPETETVSRAPLS